MLTHLLHLCIKCRLLLFRQLRVKECRLQNGRVKGKALLSHGAEEPLAEVGHHVPQAVDHGLHMLHLPVFPKVLLLKTLDFAVEIRESYPSVPDISSGSPVNGMRILPISIRREYSTRPPSSRWRIFIRLRAALTKTNTSPSRRFIPIRFVTMPLRPLNPRRMFTGRL